MYDDGKVIAFYGVDNPPPPSLEYASNMLQIMGHFLVSCIKRRNLMSLLENMSYKDQLTKLGNRFAMEKYINENVDYDPLIRAALIHYQFETIHPFLDGNGRIGRLLILLYLMEQRLIEKPVIYISYFLKKNQIEYYDRISEVRRTGNFEQWIRFFLEAVSKAASDSLEAIRQLSVLHDTNVEKLPKTTRSKDNLRAVFDYIEQYPIIDIKRTAKELEVSYNTVAAAVRKLVELGILQETTNAARNRVFAYEEYLAILRKDT